MELNHIAVRGAREHNLRDIDLDVPKKRLVVFTGVSGSGKSSLAFDTLYAEGQRRYVESLSAYARQFLGQMDKPHYDSIRGLSPTIAIEQKTSSSNPRSTVGTVTEVYDYLRVLFARLGVQRCPGCGSRVGRQSVEEIADTVTAWPERTRFTVMAPLARRRKGTAKALFDEARRDGFVRVRVDGEFEELADRTELDKKRPHDIDLVIDRLAVTEGVRSRLVDSLETAFRKAEGAALILRADTNEEVLFSERHHCATCDRSFPEPSPQLFSFNSPTGMCPSCQGLGTRQAVDLDQLVPDGSLSLAHGAVRPWATMMAGSRKGERSWTAHIVDAVCARFEIDVDAPWNELPETARRILLHGTDEPIDVPVRSGSGTYKVKFEGIARTLLRLWRETQSEEMRRSYLQYLSTIACDACAGSRLREESRHVEIEGLRMPRVVTMPITALRERLEGLGLTGARAEIAREVVREIGSRLRFLDDVGLGYLALARGAGTLSGGESQRIRLASQIGTELTGVIYILDEPSIGLHPRDGQRLLNTLCRLRDIGNSVLVVEHDADIMRAADWIVDFGPGAGTRGGHVVAAGTPAEILASPDSLTGAYLSGRREIAVPRGRRVPSSWLTVRGARENNLAGIDVSVPLGVLTVVTGVSGAGKSTLVNQILRPALMRHLHGSVGTIGAHDGIDGLDALDKLVDIDQRPIGRTPRSNPATYTKLFDEIRKVFAATREARMYGYTPGRFSFNVKGGRCEQCTGDGAIKVEMHFLPDVYVTCETCGGKRYNDSTLRVTFKGLSVADVLAQTVDEALEAFSNHKKVKRILTTLHDVGLGYVALGQASTTLSGGEAQRVKLSRELARVQTGRTLYLLDEPSTGLHFADVERLLLVLDRLVEAGNSVVMIEHHLDIIKVADHVIDLGPEGGGAGGQVVATGTPEQVAGVSGSYTGGCLAEALRRPR